MPQNVLDYAKFKEVLEKPDIFVPVIKVKLYHTLYMHTDTSHSKILGSCSFGLKSRVESGLVLKELEFVHFCCRTQELDF